MAFIQDDLNGLAVYQTGVYNLEEAIRVFTNGSKGYYIKGSDKEMSFEVFAPEKYMASSVHCKIYLIKPGSPAVLQRYKTIPASEIMHNPRGSYISWYTPVTSAYPDGAYLAILTGKDLNGKDVQVRSITFEIFSSEPRI